MNKRLWILAICSLVMVLSVRIAMSLYSPWTGFAQQSPNGTCQLLVLGNNQWVKIILGGQIDEHTLVQYPHDGHAWQLCGKGTINWSQNADHVTAIYKDMVRGRVCEVEFHMDLHEGGWTMGVHPIDPNSVVNLPHEVDH